MIVTLPAMNPNRSSVCLFLPVGVGFATGFPSLVIVAIFFIEEYPFFDHRHFIVIIKWVEDDSERNRRRHPPRFNKRKGGTACSRPWKSGTGEGGRKLAARRELPLPHLPFLL